MMTAIRHVLIIDDEPDIREIAKISLHITKQWTVMTAASGPEGISMAVAKSPDLILLDVMMPEVDGPATLRALKQNPKTQHIPVILLTATAKLAPQSECVEEEACGILVKPFDPGTFGDKIQALLASKSHI